MFTVSFYTNNSDNRYVNKILRNVKLNVQCQLKEGTSIYKPTVILNFDDSIYNANYMYIAETSRYYYISDIYVEKQRMYISTSESDVLMSFKEQLLNKQATVARQQNLFNTYLVDNEYQVYNYRNIQIKKFDYEFRENPTIIMNIAGGKS